MNSIYSNVFLISTYTKQNTLNNTYYLLEVYRGRGASRFGQTLAGGGKSRFVYMQKGGNLDLASIKPEIIHHPITHPIMISEWYLRPDLIELSFL